MSGLPPFPVSPAGFGWTLCRSNASGYGPHLGIIVESLKQRVKGPHSRINSTPNRIRDRKNKRLANAEQRIEKGIWRGTLIGMRIWKLDM